MKKKIKVICLFFCVLLIIQCLFVSCSTYTDEEREIIAKAEEHLFGLWELQGVDGEKESTIRRIEFHESYNVSYWRSDTVFLSGEYSIEWDFSESGVCKGVVRAELQYMMNVGSIVGGMNGYTDIEDEVWYFYIEYDIGSDKLNMISNEDGYQYVKTSG